MESNEILTTNGGRYTVFSLWDTYRNVHQLLTLVYPERQMEMVRTMLDMYREHGWFPKWELYGRETLTMEGDPSIPVIVDTWMKGLRDFDVDLAYEAMYKSATLPGAENLMRPDNDDYMSKGYVPLREQYDNSVSHALEYYIADFALSRFADALGKKKDAEMFYKRSLCPAIRGKYSFKSYPQYERNSSAKASVQFIPPHSQLSVSINFNVDPTCFSPAAWRIGSTIVFQ